MEYEIILTVDVGHVDFPRLRVRRRFRMCVWLSRNAKAQKKSKSGSSASIVSVNWLAIQRAIAILSLFFGGGIRICIYTTTKHRLA